MVLLYCWFRVYIYIYKDFFLLLICIPSGPFSRSFSMEKEKATPWLSVPQFGDWDQKGGALPDYSMDFSKIREMRKQNKRDPSRASLGNEEELISSATSNSNNAHSDEHDQFHQNHSPAVRFLCWPFSFPFPPPPLLYFVEYKYFYGRFNFCTFSIMKEKSCKSLCDMY